MDGERGAGAERTVSPMPVRFFWIAAGWLVLLVGLFVLWQTWSDFRDWLPAQLGPLPFEVPWFGALGGSMISLAGIFRHNREWDPKYDYWHYARPLVGAVIGSIGALLFFVLTEAADRDSLDLNATVFDALAFVIGYREKNFRDLIERAADVFFKPAEPEPEPEPEAGTEAERPRL